MNKKTLKLIYKQLDNTISEKELKILNKKLEKNVELNNEYQLILNIQNELKEFPKAELPENFSKELRYKLTLANQEKVSEKKSGHRFLYPAAGAVLAACVIVFSLSIKPDNITNTNNDDTSSTDIVAENYMRMMPGENKNESEIITNDTCDIALATAKSEDIQAYDEDVLTIQINDRLYKEIAEAFELKAIDDITYKVSMKDIDKFKEFIKDYTYTIKNETDKSLASDYFIIIFSDIF